MVDITTSAPIASASTATVLPAAIVTAVEATISSLPDNVQQLLRMLQINATVTQLPPDGSTVTLSTALGTLTLQLPQLADADEQKLMQSLLAALQNQKPLTIIIQPGNPPALATILLPPAVTPPLQNTSNNSGVNVPVQAVTTTPPPSLTSGTILSAVVLPPDIVVPSSAPTQQSVQITTPATDAHASSASTQIVPPPMAQNTALSSPRIASLLQPGNEVTLQVNAVLPENPPPSIPLATNQIVATVVGNATGGQLILKAGDATLFVRQSADISVGTNLLVIVDATKASPPLPIALPDKQNFDTLQQVFSALNQIDPQLTGQLLKNNIPQPATPMFPETLLFLLSAFKQGEPRSWLGNSAIDMLNKAGKFELISKLMQDMGKAETTTQDGIVGEWRSYPVPIYNNQQFQMLNLYVHKDQQQHSNTASPEKQNRSHVRFLIDVQFSKLGAVQLDGFAQTRKLDLIIRSEHALPTGLHTELRGTYTRALMGINYAGSLNFQVGRNGWITLQPPTHKTLST